MYFLSSSPATSLQLWMTVTPLQHSFPNLNLLACLHGTWFDGAFDLFQKLDLRSQNDLTPKFKLQIGQPALVLAVSLVTTVSRTSQQQSISRFLSSQLELLQTKFLNVGKWSTPNPTFENKDTFTLRILEVPISPYTILENLLDLFWLIIKTNRVLTSRTCLKTNLQPLCVVSSPHYSLQANLMHLENYS